MAASVAEAEALFAGYRIALRIEDKDAGDANHQAALLTAVVLSRRVFLGGVTVAAIPDVPLQTPLPFGATLGEAVIALGAGIGHERAGDPIIAIGGPPRQRQGDFDIRALFAGWRAGIEPAHLDASFAPGPVMPLAPMLAAALAVNEAFLFASGDMATAGRRSVGLSPWSPSPETDWLDAAHDEPVVALLPSRLWLIGLGHLGQAYLWALGLLPYADPGKLSLVLQDIDIITPSTESTSILSNATLIGRKKTRAMAQWAEGRGFSTAIHERKFDAGFRRRDEEPSVALCGVDNALGRQALDQAGFDFVVEAGLGRGYRDFRALRLHTLPASRSAAKIWHRRDDDEKVDGRPAGKLLLKSGELDICGVTLLAGKAVGAPFVGAVAASLVIAEVLRLLHGGPLHQLIDVISSSRNSGPPSARGTISAR